MDKSIAFIINESEITAGTRGASLGPAAMKVAAHNKGSYLFGQHPNYVIPTENHLLDSPTDYQYAKRIDGLVKVFNHTIETVSKAIDEGSFPIVIAGDHGSAGGTVAAIKSKYPNKRLGVVWIDAHGDLHTPYTTPSGNMHGMPLATALANDNKECQINEPSDTSKKLWEELKNAGGIAPKITSDDLIFIGVRDTEQPEDQLIAREGIKNFTVEEVNELGTEKLMDQVFERLSDCDHIYISFDVDSMDPDIVSYGTGTPVKNGLKPADAAQILNKFAAHSKVSCIEFVEVNPCLDNKVNEMAEVAYDLLEDVAEIIKNR